MTRPSTPRPVKVEDVTCDDKGGCGEVLDIIAVIPKRFDTYLKNIVISSLKRRNYKVENVLLKSKYIVLCTNKSANSGNGCSRDKASLYVGFAYKIQWYDPKSKQWKPHTGSTVYRTALSDQKLIRTLGLSTQGIQPEFQFTRDRICPKHIPNARQFFVDGQVKRWINGRLNGKYQEYNMPPVMDHKGKLQIPETTKVVDEQKSTILSLPGNPNDQTVNAILHAMGQIVSAQATQTKDILTYQERRDTALFNYLASQTGIPIPGKQPNETNVEQGTDTTVQDKFNNLSEYFQGILRDTAVKIYVHASRNGIQPEQYGKFVSMSEQYPSVPSTQGFMRNLGITNFPVEHFELLHQLLCDKAFEEAARKTVNHKLSMQPIRGNINTEAAELIRHAIQPPAKRFPFSIAPWYVWAIIAVALTILIIIAFSL